VNILLVHAASHVKIGTAGISVAGNGLRKRGETLPDSEESRRLGRGTSEMDRYKVRPRKTRDGWNLEGERLSHGSLWYKNESAAVDYARWNSRVNDCRIEILDERDQVVRTAKFTAADFAY
jgi:hypothetical protein